MGRHGDSERVTASPPLRVLLHRVSLSLRHRVMRVAALLPLVRHDDVATPETDRVVLRFARQGQAAGHFDPEAVDACARLVAVLHSRAGWA
jgi:hypothetical protein